MAIRQSQDHRSPSDAPSDVPACFVIMPISEPLGYEQGHFRKVYDQILAPACRQAGFDPVRADDIKGTNLIHVDILQSVLSAPMPVCDLSSWNPNVLYELGLRQAFDKPVVLVQQVDTPGIFDIAPLRYIEYRREFKYEEVLADQQHVAEAIHATRDNHNAGTAINSLVKILGLVQVATLPEVSGQASTAYLELIRSEIEELRGDIRSRTYHLLANKDVDIDVSEMEQLSRQIMETHKILDAKEGTWCGGRHDSGFTVERMASNVDHLVNSCLPEQVRRLNDLAHGAKMKGWTWPPTFAASYPDLLGPEGGKSSAGRSRRGTPQAEQGVGSRPRTRWRWVALFSPASRPSGGAVRRSNVRAGK